MRATGTTSTAGTPIINSANSNASSALGTSLTPATQFGGNSLSSSSGGENVNNNGSYMSSSFTPTTTYTMRNYSSSNSSSYSSRYHQNSSSNVTPNVTSPNATSPNVTSPPLSSEKSKAKLVHAEIPVYSGNPLSPSLNQPTSPRPITSPRAPSLSLDSDYKTNKDDNKNNNNDNNISTNDNNKSDKGDDEINDDASLSVDVSSMGISESKSSPPSSPSSSSSANTSASASSHASQRNFASGEKGGIRNSNSMEFAYIHGEVRPSILSITNALAVQEVKLGELMVLNYYLLSKTVPTSFYRVLLKSSMPSLKLI